MKKSETCEFESSCYNFDTKKTLEIKKIEQIYPTISNSSYLVFKNKFTPIHNNNYRSHDNIFQNNKNIQ